MEIGTIQTLITDIGFPIVAVIALAWFIYKAFNKFMTQSENREEKLYTVIAQAQETNEKLSRTNAEFVEVLRSYSNDIEEIKEDISEIKIKMSN